MPQPALFEPNFLDEIFLTFAVATADAVVLVIIIHLVSQEATYSAEAHDELRAFGALVSHEHKFTAEIFVVLSDPVNESLFFNNIEFLLGLFINERVVSLELLGGHVPHNWLIVFVAAA